MSDDTKDDKPFDPDEITDERPLGRNTEYYKAIAEAERREARKGQSEPARERKYEGKVEVLGTTPEDLEFTAYLDALTAKYGPQ